MEDELPLPIAGEAEEHTLISEQEPEIGGKSAFLAQIREVADKLAHDQATRGDIKIIARAIKELRYAFKVFTPYRLHRKVTVFGSARTPANHPDYLSSVEFGRLMAKNNWMVLTGAGGGIMEGAHVGAGLPMSMGVNILLPFEQQANSVIDGDPKLVTFRFFFTRKLMFVKEVHAIVVYPGGFGTLDELFETLTLIQTGKRDMLPIVLVDQPDCNYWCALQDFIRHQLLERGLISPADLSLYRIVHSPAAAVSEVLSFYRVYNSMRFVKQNLVLRLNHPISDELLDQLNVEFADLLISGTIERTAAHPFEADEPHLKDLPRLRFHFERRETGRLRQMIDALNLSPDVPTPELSPQQPSLS